VSGSRPRRTKEDYLLLVVSVSAAAVAVASWRRAESGAPELWAAMGVALAVSLAMLFTFLVAGSVRKAAFETAPEEDGSFRRVLAAVPDGLVVLDGSRVIAANGRFCELVGFSRDELADEVAPLPFWPPEHRHEIERWHAWLAERGEHAGRLTFVHRGGDRLPVLVAGRRVAGGSGSRRYVVTVRDVSESNRRERRLSELSSRDPETALLNEHGFDERLREAVRRSIADGTNASVVVATLGSDVAGGTGHLASPAGLLVVERLVALLRAGDELGRMGDDEIAWVLPGTGADGAVEAVDRARQTISDTGATLTAGVCDLETAGDAPSLFALADRALAEARRGGSGRTVSYPHMRLEALASVRGG